MSIKVSILIASLRSRENVLSVLLNNINNQFPKCPIHMERVITNCCFFQYFNYGEVQLIVATDNKENTTGRKRQLLLENSKGEYIVFIDDDDAIYDYYVEELLKAVNTGADCIGMKGIITTDGNNEIEWRLSKDYQNETIEENGKMVYLRTTNHIAAVKRSIAIQCGFPDISNGEDKEYSQRIHPFLLTETKIDKLMYHYIFSTQNKEY